MVGTAGPLLDTEPVERGNSPKGAFFCEIAGSLDMLFDGPGGWPIEPGWWKRTPADFGDQLKWCEMCSVALKVPTMDANEETDIVSPWMLKELKQINGPKIRNNKFVVFDPANYDAAKYAGHEADPIWYLPRDQGDKARVSPTHNSLYPRRIDVGTARRRDSQATLGRERVERLNFPDWVAVFRDPGAVNGEFLAADQMHSQSGMFLQLQGRGAPFQPPRPGSAGAWKALPLTKAWRDSGIRKSALF